MSGIHKSDDGRGSLSSSTQQSLKRLLEVRIIKATQLGGVKKPTVDAYVQASLIDLGGREIKKESFKTKVQQDNNNPEWNQTFSFGQIYDLSSSEDLPSLDLSVYHKPAHAISAQPLGVINIPLENIDADGETNLTLDLKPAGRMEKAQGKISVSLKFTGSSAGGDVEAGLTAREDKAADVAAEEENDAEPNELIVTIIRGKRLLGKSRDVLSTGTHPYSSPFVKLEIGPGYEKFKTKHILRNLNPTWQQEFIFKPIVDPSCTLQVTVKDHESMMDSFIGRVAIPLSHFDDKKPVTKWYKLKSSIYEDDGIDRGEIELKIHWKFDTKTFQEIQEAEKSLGAVGKKLLHAGQHLAHNLFGIGEGSDEEIDEEFEEKEESREREEEEKEEETKSEEELKKEEERMKELESIEVKDGDYQILIHIIEARELKAENEDGTSDPVVFIECFGQKRNTIAVRGVTSCVYDEVFIFNVKNMDKDTFAQSIIRVVCRDSSLVGKGMMIGAYSFDAMTVYSMNSDHEMYRTWVPLMDDEEPLDIGVQGYLKISVQIVGPGEKVKVHDEASDRATEKAAEAAAGSDIGSMLMLTPTIITEWKYIRMRIFKAEGLPVMDGKVGVGVLSAGEAGVDAVISLSFAGGKKITTPTRTIKGKSRSLLNPYFNCELWYPISVPTLTQVIKIGVYDEDSTGLELIGQVIERLNNVKKANQQSLPIRWYNVYGAAEFKQESVMKNISKTAETISKKAKQRLGLSVDWFEFYNNSPEKAPCFKGRVLAQISLVDKPPKRKGAGKGDVMEISPFRRKLRQHLSSKLEPKNNVYILQAIVFSGGELPSFKSFFSDRFRIKISIGIHDICTKSVKLENGICRWNEMLRSDRIFLPADHAQLPDVLVYLLREDEKPVCFKRISVVRNDHLMGFDKNAEWVMLQEDKSIDALNKNVFPGKILIKLGFGLETDADSDHVQNSWKKVVEQSRKNTPYQVRVHVFQGKDLPAADSDGLCDPYLKVSFMSQVHKTRFLKKTLYPCFHQTLTYQNVAIPDADDFLYAPMICFRLFDHDDYDDDDYLGTCFFHLGDAFISDAPSNDGTIEDVLEKDPAWLTLFYETPGDSQGEILVAVQLIPTYGSTIPKPPSDPFQIQAKDAYIEFLVIGMRDLAPYNFQAMQNPFIQMELNSCGTKFSTETKHSKEPEPQNPNFLQRILMPVKLPVNSLFTTPLLLKAKDNRLGGFLKPTVGVCQIDLSNKLPWDTDKYIPPRTDLFKDETRDEEEAPRATKNPLLAREQVEGETSAPISIGNYLREILKDDDTGAGIFGAIQHIDVDSYSKGSKRKGEIQFFDAEKEEEPEQPPKWMLNRNDIKMELEKKFETKPFESYNLMRGQSNGLLGSTLKCVGKVKGIVRVVEKKEDLDSQPLFEPNVMADLLKPKKYVIRLYALRAINLAEMDMDIFGGAGKSDPYLKVTLGNKVFNDRENAVDNVLEVDLYKLVTLETELPGVSMLNIDIYDKDLIGYDDLIGRTSIDLEDRVFDKRWQEYGTENLTANGSDIRWATKPIEARTLYSPSQTTSQGELICYLDIMTPVQAKSFPPDDVALPPKQIFEVRVVIWKTRDVPPMDTFEGMSDLFVKCWPEGCTPQETDTHWRCKKGKASFNWRLLFDVELGHNTRAMKFPYLHFQLWDRDLLKWNDCAGESAINLEKYYKKAYRNNAAIKLFETAKGTALRRKEMKKKAKSGTGLVDDEEDVPPEEEGEEDDRITFEKEQEELELNSRAAVPPSVPAQFKSASTLLPERKDADSDDEEEEIKGKDAEKQGKRYTVVRSKPDKKKKMKEAKKPAKKSSLKTVSTEPKTETEKEAATPKKSGCWPFGGKKDEDKEEKEPLLEKKQDKETQNMLNMIKNMTGLWDIDPEDSTWINIEFKDKNEPGKVEPRGSICYSVQIWPKEKAAAMPVGAARNNPNANPFLPPPVGRMKFSLNPFVMGSELCGPALCAKIVCCFLCLACCALMIFCQPFLNIIINIIFVVY